MKMHSVLCLKCVMATALGLLVPLLLTLAITVPLIVLLIVLWTISFSFFKRLIEVLFMFMKIFILVCLFGYIVLASQNLYRKDSYLLIERFYKFLKHLYYYLFD